MTRLLIVDDEKNIREVVKEYSQLNGYEVDEAENGIEALNLFNRNEYDCVVLDIMMPKLDGYSVCKQMKAQKKVPIIMLSARGEEYDKLLGFDLGVDDYVVKPFSPKELMARIKVVLDRTYKAKKKMLEYKTLVVDVEARNVYVDNELVSLTPKEIDLLIYFMENPNIALSREKLLEEVWHYDYFGDDRTIDAHVKMLRHNIKEYRDVIVTVRGMGYKFETR